MRQSDNEVKSVVQGWIKKQLDNAHVALPGVIKSYNPTSNRASVKPSGNFKTKDGRSLPYPVIYNAPVQFPTGKGGGAGVTFPIAPGDGCLIVFSDESISGYLSGSGNADDPRKHSMNDAVVIPGLYPGGATAAASNHDETCLTCDGSIARLGSSHFIIELANGTKFNIAEGISGSFADGTTLSIGGGDLDVSGISHSHHTHPGIQPGGANTGEPQ